MTITVVIRIDSQQFTPWRWRI